MILVACPGGLGSNLLSYIYRGDAALSVTLTAFNSILSLLSISFLVGLSVQFYLLDNPGSIYMAKIINAFIDRYIYLQALCFFCYPC